MSASFFSNNLKILRKYNKLSQDKLAQELNVGRNKIASYEGRSIEPKLGLLVDMSRYFQITIEDLITRDLSEENIEKCIERYYHLNYHEEADEHSESSTLHVPVEMIEALRQKNDEVSRIADGFESFIKIEKEEGGENMNYGQAHSILKVLRHLLSYEKMFISGSLQK